MNKKLFEIFAKYDADTEEAHAADLAKALELRQQTAEKHETWLQAREAEAVSLEHRESLRTLVRPPLLEMIERAEQQGISLEEALWATLCLAAGALDELDLDDPADLRVRRLGKTMKNTKIRV